MVNRDSPAFFTVEPQLRREPIKLQCGSEAGRVMAAFDRFPKKKIRELADQHEPLTLALASGELVSLVPLEHFELTAKGVDGWAVVEHLGTIVGVDTRINDALKKEGMAREVVR